MFCGQCWAHQRFPSFPFSPDLRVTLCGLECLVQAAQGLPLLLHHCSPSGMDYFLSHVDLWPRWGFVIFGLDVQQGQEGVLDDLVFWPRHWRERKSKSKSTRVKPQLCSLPVLPVTSAAVITDLAKQFYVSVFPNILKDSKKTHKSLSRFSINMFFYYYYYSFFQLNHAKLGWWK